MAKEQVKTVARQRGFVLPMALVVLSLLTLLATAMYFVSRTSIETSHAAVRSTQAYYFAEAGLNYLAWALNNDADFDSYASAQPHSFSASEPAVPPQAGDVGDYSEWLAYPWYPGPTLVSDQDPLGKSGQILYLDNRPLGQRYLCAESAVRFPNCIDFSLPASQRFRPEMQDISSRLPRYIRLDMKSDGSIVPSIPRLPHRKPAVVGEDVPYNGAIVWLTAGDANRDIEIFPLDPHKPSLYGGLPPESCTGNSLPACPCDKNAPGFATAQACDANTGQWLREYGLVAYAIGYVRGEPAAILRSVIK